LSFCLALIAAVNDERVLQRDLAASPLLGDGAAERFFYRGARNMAEAYNAGIDATTAPVMVFAHQDVYLPAGWERRLAAAIAEVEGRDPEWAVLGIVGATTDGRMAGQAWSSGSAREFTHDIALPQPAQSLDELVLVLRREAGLRFDPQLPHFHLYGTDIVQQALADGRGAWIAGAPVVHNSDQLTGLGAGYRRAYGYMRAKWADRLPIVTPICPVVPGWRRFLRAELAVRYRYARQRWRGRGRRRALDDPRAKALMLGYE